jgi:amino acid transporter
LSTFSLIKRGMLGRPIATEQEMQERLPKKYALPVFSSDAISSTAYATEEILLALILAGSAALTLSLPVAIAVALLLAIVALSYQQTVRAYPSGGGSYVVSRENLGMAPGLIAAASLMFGYVATVAVSVASGVAAITSAFPELYEWRVYISVGLILLVMIGNLRGVRESGRVFAVPTYAFILLCGGLIVVGLIRWLMGDLQSYQGETVAGVKELTFFLILRAFAGGCAAMTGTEAISNAVPAFKPPESKNASVTLGLMAAVLGFLLIGVTALSQVTKVHPAEGDTVLSQVARLVYGDGGFLYFALQIATMAILVLGANTCYAGFPRLSSVLARDGLMPRQFMNRGNRLVYSNGIIALTVVAIVLILIFQADTHRMIPFYALGVFIGFTLSQSGMVVHWRRLRGHGWRRKAGMNTLGAVLTGVVAAVILATKFTQGAWIVVAAVPVLVALFYSVNRHYRRVAEVLKVQDGEELQRLAEESPVDSRTTVVIFVAQVNSLTARALALARALAPHDVRAVTISNDPAATERLQATWTTLGIKVPLEVVDSPFREFVKTAVAYIRSLNPSPEHTITVVVPELVVEHWWEAMLHNQDALRLKGSLLREPWVVVMNIPLHVGAARRKAEGAPDARMGEAAVPAATPASAAEPAPDGREATQATKHPAEKQ